MDGEDLYLDIGQGVPKMQLVSKIVIFDQNSITFQKDEREAAFMTVWREEVVKKLGYALRLPRSPTWGKAKD